VATLLSTKQVLAKTRLPRSTFYMYRAEGRFPQPVRVFDHAVAWLESDVNEWLMANPPAPRAHRDP
jgi:prophage regulatory protein